MIIKKGTKFDWDHGNTNKNEKHGVNDRETEEVFFDKNKKTFRDKLHSNKEERFRIIGKTKKNRVLFIVFTIRDDKLRVISARKLNKREVYLYEKEA